MASVRPDSGIGKTLLTRLTDSRWSRRRTLLRTGCAAVEDSSRSTRSIVSAQDVPERKSCVVEKAFAPVLQTGCPNRVVEGHRLE